MDAKQLSGQGVHIVINGPLRPLMSKADAINTLRWMIEMLEGETEAEVITLEFGLQENVVRPWSFEQFQSHFQVEKEVQQ